MKTNQAKLAISLVTYNAEKYLPFCLSSLARQTFQNFSLLIIDNGSTDGTVGFLRENYPQIKLVHHQNNIGFAKAHNQTIAWSTSDFIMLLNQDVILEPDYLEKAVDYLDKHPLVAALGGKILVWDFENNQKTKIIDSLGLKIYKNHKVVDLAQGEEDRGQCNQATEVFGVSGTLPIYRRLLLEKIKINFSAAFKPSEYLDEDFFSYKEDVDLAYRLQLAGFKAIYYPVCLAYHHRTVSGSTLNNLKFIKKSRRQRERSIKIYSYKNHLLAILKNEFLINLIKFCLPIFWYELRKFFYLLIFEPATLNGLKLFIRQKSKIMEKRKYIIKNIRTIKAKELAKWY